jgi:putative transposase
VLAYLSRYTHRVAIANSRLISCDRSGVTFRWKDYRAEGRDRQKVMTLATAEFIRRFLIHVLPHGFHRIRHYGLLASGTHADNIARARRLLDVPAAQPETGDDSCAEADHPKPLTHPCPCCGGRMIIIERFQRGASPRYRPAAAPRRHQDRHIMIKVGARQNCSAASLLRRISTGNDQARPRAARDSRRVVRSRTGDAGSADRNRPTGVVIPLIASHTSVQQTSATDRRR